MTTPTCPGDKHGDGKTTMPPWFVCQERQPYTHTWTKSISRFFFCGKNICNSCCSLEGITKSVAEILKLTEVAPEKICAGSTSRVGGHYLVGGFNHLKHISQIGSSPQVGVTIKNIWNHHIVNLTTKVILMQRPKICQKNKTTQPIFLPRHQVAGFQNHPSAKKNIHQIRWIQKVEVNIP